VTTHCVDQDYFVLQLSYLFFFRFSYRKKNVYSKGDNDNAALAAFTEAGGIGKTQEEVIEEQRRIMAEARLQHSPRLPADGGYQQQDIKHEKKNSFEVVEHAMVHPQPNNNQAPPAACKGYPDSKGVNPLYEYSRSKQGM
jgi:hypothetical protein